MPISLFNIKLFNDEKVIHVVSNISIEQVYNTIPKIILSDKGWTIATNKEIFEQLFQMRAGESYCAAWNTSNLNYILIAKMSFQDNKLINRNMQAQIEKVGYDKQSGDKQSNDKENGHMKSDVKLGLSSDKQSSDKQSSHKQSSHKQEDLNDTVIAVYPTHITAFSPSTADMKNMDILPASPPPEEEDNLTEYRIFCVRSFDTLLVWFFNTFLVKVNKNRLQNNQLDESRLNYR